MFRTAKYERWMCDVAAQSQTLFTNDNDLGIDHVM